MGFRFRKKSVRTLACSYFTSIRLDNFLSLEIKETGLGLVNNPNYLSMGEQRWQPSVPRNEGRISIRAISAKLHVTRLIARCRLWSTLTPDVLKGAECPQHPSRFCIYIKCSPESNLYVNDDQQKTMLHAWTEDTACLDRRYCARAPLV